MQPEEYHIVEGETIQLPTNLKGEFEKHQASLLMSKNGIILKNMFSRIKVIDGQINLESLEAAEYQLRIKDAKKPQVIKITVHKGTYWQGQFILKKNCLLESSASKKILQISKVEAKQENQETNMTVHL